MVDSLCVANAQTIFLLVIVFMIAVMTIGAIALLVKCLVIAKGGEAIVRTGQGGTQVRFDKLIVIPVLHAYQRIDISVRKLRYERNEDLALQFKCGTGAELVADLMIRVNADADDVKRAVSFLGSER
ncbi:MAG: hypothetical protein AB8B55_16205 [Mariniblastus sp.]